MTVAVHKESGVAHWNGRGTTIGHIVKYQRDLLVLTNGGEYIIYSVNQVVSNPDHEHDYYMVNITSRITFK